MIESINREQKQQKQIFIVQVLKKISEQQCLKEKKSVEDPLYSQRTVMLTRVSRNKNVGLLVPDSYRYFNPKTFRYQIYLNRPTHRIRVNPRFFLSVVFLD